MNRFYAALFLLSAGLAQPVAYAPLPKVQPLGTVQPVAPGFQKAPPLPQIVLNPLIPQVRRLEYASNGRIEAAHALVLLPQASSTLGAILPLAQRVVTRTFAARPGLAVVDLSVYQAEGYAGYGGPLPLFTASVAKVRLGEFVRLSPATVASFDHLWVNPSTPHPPLLAPTGATPPQSARGAGLRGRPGRTQGPTGGAGAPQRGWPGKRPGLPRRPGPAPGRPDLR